MLAKLTNLQDTATTYEYAVFVCYPENDRDAGWQEITTYKTEREAREYVAEKLEEYGEMPEEFVGKWGIMFRTSTYEAI